MTRNRELTIRIFSALALAIIVIFITLWDPISFNTMVAIGGLIAWREWRNLTQSRSLALKLFGPIYIAVAAVGLMYLRGENLNILLSLFAIVWAGDSAAYLVGSRLGKHKIAPAISPGKSWEGLAASVIVSAAVGAGLGHVAPIPHAILGAVLAVVGLAGDMFESSLKRRAGVKDSGTLIPGHGGLLDRIDALIPCAILAAVALYLRLHR